MRRRSGARRRRRALGWTTTRSSPRSSARVAAGDLNAPASRTGPSPELERLAPRAGECVEPDGQAGIPHQDLELVTACDADAMARHSGLGQRIPQPIGVPRLARDDHAAGPLPEQRRRRSICLDRHRCAAAGRDGDARERDRQAADRDVVRGGERRDPPRDVGAGGRPGSPLPDPATAAHPAGPAARRARRLPALRRRRRDRRSARSRSRCATPSAPRDRARRGDRPSPRPASGGSVRPASRCRG